MQPKRRRQSNGGSPPRAIDLWRWADARQLTQVDKLKAIAI
jgi:hypothetical protein